MRFPQFSVVVCWQKAEETPARHFPNIGTIDLRIVYLRPGRGQHSVATGRVGRLGGRVAVAHMELVKTQTSRSRPVRLAYIAG